MQIAHKFTAALVGCLAVPLTLGATISVRAQLQRIEDDIAAHQTVIGRAVLPPILRAWQSEGPEGALERTYDANVRYGDVNIRLVWLTASTDNRMRPSVDVSRLAPLRAGQEAHYIDHDYDENGRFFTFVPAPLPNGPAAIEVSQSLARERQVLRDALWDTALLALGLAVAAALTASLVGAWLLGRPLRGFIEQAKRVGLGDLTYRIEGVRPDELGALAHEMNRMCESLAEAQVRVARETDERIRAESQLRHKDRLATVGRLASGLAHELGTPLSVALARLKGVRRDAETLDAAGTSSRVSIAIDQLERISVLLRRLLDFARSRKLVRTDVDLRSVASRTAVLLGPIAKKQNVSIVVSDGDPLVAQIDAIQFEQVLTNLVMNAIAATSDGAPVTMAVYPTRSAPPDGGEQMTCACVEVRDEGVGIDELELDHIFEPFFTTREVGEGTGLGLSIAYGIVRDHGGWIGVESERGHGASFRVFLPTGRT
jgi:signal transduction histidine kinase